MSRPPLAALMLLFWPSGRALAAVTPSRIDTSPRAAAVMLGADTAWAGWLKANYPLEVPLTKGQERALKALAGTKWDERFVGDLDKDGAPGALLAKFSPSLKTLARFEILRWSNDGWKPMIRCGQHKLVYGKNAPITSSESVDVYQIYLQRQNEGLGFMITFGNAGDKLFGDAVSLSYDRQARSYVEPDDTDHD